jgi:hypothetical protein
MDLPLAVRTFAFHLESEIIMQKFLGIDPGKSGGIALLTDDDILQVWPMPSSERMVASFFEKRIIPAGITFALIEHEQGWSGEAQDRVTKFIRGFGILLGILYMSHIDFDEIWAQTWHKALGIKQRYKPPKPKPGFALVNFIPEETKAQFKNRLCGHAKQLFPGHDSDLDLDTCDAALIAETARRIRTGYRGKALF